MRLPPICAAVLFSLGLVLVGADSGGGGGNSSECWICRDRGDSCIQGCGSCFDKRKQTGHDGLERIRSVPWTHKCPWRAEASGADNSTVTGGDCVAGCDECAGASYSCNSTCSQSCTSCFEDDVAVAWQCASIGKCILNCEFCPGASFPPSIEQDRFEKEMRRIQSTDRYGHWAQRILIMNKYKKMTGIDFNCMSESAYMKLRTSRCRAAVAGIQQMMMLAVGTAAVVHIFTYLFITAWPGKHHANYKNLVVGKVKEAAPITSALFGGIIAVSRSTYLLAQKDQCMTPTGWDWATFESFPNMKSITQWGILLAHSLGGLYIILNFILKTTGNMLSITKIRKQVVSSFRTIVVTEGAYNVVCPAKAGCPADVSSLDQMPEHCFFNSHERVQCLANKPKRLDKWRWKNLFFRAERKGLLPNTIKSMAMKGYLWDRRSVEANMFMLFYELTIISFGYASAHLFCYAIQYRPGDVTDEEGSSRAIQTTQITMWLTTAVLGVVTYSLFISITIIRDGFKVYCGEFDLGVSAPPVDPDHPMVPQITSLHMTRRQCTLWRDCMTCDGLVGQDAERCNIHNYALSLANVTDRSQQEKWLERTATCWALTRRLSDVK